MKAICPGSFDPVTFGHLDIVSRTAQMFDEVIVAVGHNMSKSGLFQPQERVDMIRECVAELPNVSVVLFQGLLVDYCRAHGIGAIAKGLRFGADFDYELQMSQMNSHLSGVDTLFLPTSAQWSFVSSSLVREVALLGGDISALVPPPVIDRIRRKLAERAATKEEEA